MNESAGQLRIGKQRVAEIQVTLFPAPVSGVRGTAVLTTMVDVKGVLRRVGRVLAKAQLLTGPDSQAQMKLMPLARSRSLEQVGLSLFAFGRALGVAEKGGSAQDVAEAFERQSVDVQ